MWLLPIIRPLPGQASTGPGDWIQLTVVLVVLGALAAFLVVTGNRARVTSKPASQHASPDQRAPEPA